MDDDLTDPGDDALRDRLAALDPMPSSAPVDPAQGPRARSLMEHAMTSTSDRPRTETPRTAPRRTGLLATAAAAALLAGGLGAYALVGGSDDAPAGDGGSLTLAVGTSDPFASCLRPDAAGLAAFPVAFAGTVTEVTPETVTVDVTRWYTGGDAGTVTLQGTAAPASLTGVEFTGGEQVLVSALEGTVTSCGYSGTASPELQALYDQAFAG